MARPQLHLDADTSRKSLFAALVALGHHVTRRPNSWMGVDATDGAQSLGATAQGRIIFTFG
ncbi:MAG: hypothetical protein ABIQ99_03315 [Thermoflexales bacterium]